MEALCHDKSHHFSAATLCASNGSFSKAQGMRASVRNCIVALNGEVRWQIRKYVPASPNAVRQLQLAGSPQLSLITPSFFHSKDLDMCS